MHLSRRQLLQSIALAAGAQIAGGAVPVFAARQDADDVPLPFRALYQALDRQLEQIEAGIAAAGLAPSPSPPLVAELLTANSNRGEVLLRPGVPAAAALLLDRLQAIGLGGVTLSINFPLLTSGFPRRDEYVAFYRQVAEEVRRRGMRLVVETSTIFPDPEFSSAGIDYSGLTLEAYQRGKREQAEIILAELRPDFLTVESESTTVTRNTGLPFPADAYIETVRGTVAGLERGGTRIGAGTGSWDDLTLFERLAAEPDLDYLDLHIYPIWGDLLWDRTARIAEFARAAGKGLTCGESWLYKAGPGELTEAQATAVSVFGRDLYSFWSPLDQRFISSMATLAAGLEMAFCSLYWVTYLFAYLDYSDEVAQLGFEERQARLSAAVAARILAGGLSPTGRLLQQILQPPAASP